MGEMPRYTAGIRAKIVLCVFLDRKEEARDWLRRMLELQPGLTVAGLRGYGATFLAPEILEIYIEGLRKAGLPEGDPPA